MCHIISYPFPVYLSFLRSSPSPLVQCYFEFCLLTLAETTVESTPAAIVVEQNSSTAVVEAQTSSPVLAVAPAIVEAALPATSALGI